VTSEKRLPGLPDVPTMAELGYPQATISNWLGLLAPKGPRVHRHEAERGLQQGAGGAGDPREDRGAGNEIGGGTPQEFGEFIAREADRWPRLVKAAGIKVE